MLNDNTPFFGADNTRADCEDAIEKLNPCQTCHIFTKWIGRVLSFGASELRALCGALIDLRQSAVSEICGSCLFNISDTSCECAGVVFDFLGLNRTIQLNGACFKVTETFEIEVCEEKKCFRMFTCEVDRFCLPYTLDPCTEIDREFMDAMILARRQNGSGSGITAAIKAFWGEQAHIVRARKGAVEITAGRALTPAEHQRVKFIIELIKTNQFVELIYVESCEFENIFC